MKYLLSALRRAWRALRRKAFAKNGIINSMGSPFGSLIWRPRNECELSNRVTVAVKCK